MLKSIERDDNAFVGEENWNFPIPIAYGPVRLREIGTICSRLNANNPLIVTDRNSRDLPFVTSLQAHLVAASQSSQVFSDLSPNPRSDEIEAGCQAYRDGHHDAIIAIGGGSAMDGAKAIGMTVNSAVPLLDFEYRKTPPSVNLSKPFPPFITIPTTAGTGAETESGAMITDTGSRTKLCVAHAGMRPAQTILDPELIVGLPRNLTAWTGVDALTHAIEAYLVPSFHPLCDGAALEGLALISKWLPISYQEPTNISARGAMLVGSCLAGIAFNKGLGLTHAISHMVGAEYDTQHGLTNAIVLPTVLRFNLPGMDEKARRLAEAMGLEDTSVDGVIGAVEDLLDALGIPKALTEIGVPDGCAEAIARKALLDNGAHSNPKSATLSEVIELVNQSIQGARN